jgi:hypothetical protein
VDDHINNPKSRQPRYVQHLKKLSVVFSSANLCTHIIKYRQVATIMHAKDAQVKPSPDPANTVMPTGTRLGMLGIGTN